MKIAAIRISGCVGLREEINETFNRLRLRRKYSCIVFEPTKEKMGMIKKVKDHIAFGEIDDETYKLLVEKRKTKIKDFFRLHPARGGIDSKKHFGETKKAVLGNHKNKINDLIRRML